MFGDVMYQIRNRRRNKKLRSEVSDTSNANSPQVPVHAKVSIMITICLCLCLIVVCIVMLDFVPLPVCFNGLFRSRQPLSDAWEGSDSIWSLQHGKDQLSWDGIDLNPHGSFPAIAWSLNPSNTHQNFNGFWRDPWRMSLFLTRQSKPLGWTYP